MIKVKIIDGYSSKISQRRLEQVKEIFRSSFPSFPDYANEILPRMKDPVKHGYNSKLLILEKDQNIVVGFALIVHFPAIHASLLDFFAVRPAKRGAGAGGSLYEAVQDHCRQVGSHRLYIDIVPDDPILTPDQEKLEQSRKRIRFYERYGARVVLNSAYSLGVGNPPTYSMLMMDLLGTRDVLDAPRIKEDLSWIFRHRFPKSTPPAYTEQVMAIFDRDGLKLRPPLRNPSINAIPIIHQEKLAAFRMVYNPRQEIHHIQEKGYLESPVRMQAIQDALDSFPPIEQVKVEKHHEEILLQTHTPELIQYLRTVCTRLNEENPFYPDTFPIRRLELRPKNVPEQAGYYCLDDGTPLYKGAYIGAKAALDTALTAAEEIITGRRYVYAACRPPGHHAGRNFFGGFCYFNNAAAAAQLISQHATTAILDIDYHHGNGTQDIFYERPDVLTISLHGDPTYSYPYFSGYANEIGAGEGKGFNLNYPLPIGTEAPTYLRTLAKVLRKIQGFKTEILVVSLGYDILKGDPTGDFVLSYGTMGKIAQLLKTLEIPLLIVQEGGYHLNNIRRGCESFFRALLS